MLAGHESDSIEYYPSDATAIDENEESNQSHPVSYCTGSGSRDSVENIKLRKLVGATPSSKELALSEI